CLVLQDITDGVQASDDPPYVLHAAERVHQGRHRGWSRAARSAVKTVEVIENLPALLIGGESSKGRCERREVRSNPVRQGFHPQPVHTRTLRIHIGPPVFLTLAGSADPRVVVPVGKEGSHEDCRATDSTAAANPRQGNYLKKAREECKRSTASPHALTSAATLFAARGYVTGPPRPCADADSRGRHCAMTLAQTPHAPWPA